MNGTFFYTNYSMNHRIICHHFWLYQQKENSIYLRGKNKSKFKTKLNQRKTNDRSVMIEFQWKAHKINLAFVYCCFVFFALSFVKWHMTNPWLASQLRTRNTYNQTNITIHTNATRSIIIRTAIVRWMK